MESNSKISSKKLIKYLIPSILAIFSTGLISFIDGIIVGNTMGPNALSALAMSIPILYIVQMPGIAIGTGGAIIIGSLLSQRDNKKASKVFTVCLISGILLGLISTALAYPLARPLTVFLAYDLRNYIYEYILITLLIDPIIILAILINSFMGVDSNLKTATLFTITAGILKVILMLIFIKVLNWGMYGVAFSTGASYLIAFLVLIKYALSKKRRLKLDFKLKGCFNYFVETIKLSGPLLASLLLAVAHMSVVNIVISNLVSSLTDITIYGLLCNMVFVFDLFCGAIYGIIPTYCGLLYQEKNTNALKKHTRNICLALIITTLIITLLIIIFPESYAKMFGFDNPDSQERANLLIRIFVLSFMAYELNRFGGNYYSTTNKSVAAYISVILREFLIVLPLSLLLLYGDGIKGYAVAQVISEWITVIVTYIFIIINNKYTKQTEGLFMVDKIKYTSFDTLIDEFKYKDASLKQINEFLISNNINISNHII